MVSEKKRLGFAALGLCLSAGLACGQVTSGSFTPDEMDDYESYPGARSPITSVFGGAVPVSGSVSHNSVDEGDWFDFRDPAPAPLVQAQSGSKFGVLFGFGNVTLDFTDVGGASGFSGWACAAGAGDDMIEFFDMSGDPMTGTFTAAGGFGASGVMEEFSFTSPVPIGSIRLTGAETCYDDIAYQSAGATVCPDCLADCDGSGDLDFFDFLCFQNMFAEGDACADCDESGDLDFFDFLCFQNEFTAGCPVAAIDEFGTEAPPTTYCGGPMTAFPPDPQPLGATVTSVESPLGGDVVFDIGVSHRRIQDPTGFWGSWSHGYTGDVYYTQGSSVLNVSPPANNAFYLYVEPNAFALCEFRITRDGGDSVESEIQGQSGAKGFGFCGGVKTVTVEITLDPAGFNDFAVGEFGIAN